MAITVKSLRVCSGGSPGQTDSTPSETVTLTAGDTILAVVASAVSDFSTISDTAGNIYLQIGSTISFGGSDGNTAFLSLWWCQQSLAKSLARFNMSFPAGTHCECTFWVISTTTGLFAYNGDFTSNLDNTSNPVTSGVAIEPGAGVVPEYQMQPLKPAPPTTFYFGALTIGGIGGLAASFLPGSGFTPGVSVLGGGGPATPDYDSANDWNFVPQSNSEFRLSPSPIAATWTTGTPSKNYGAFVAGFSEIPPNYYLLAPPINQKYATVHPSYWDQSV